MRNLNQFQPRLLLAAGVLSAVAIATAVRPLQSHPAESATFIVQAADVASARQAVLAAGGDVERELSIIDAVAAQLTRDERDALLHTHGVRLTANTLASVSAKKNATTTSLSLSDTKTTADYLSGMTAMFDVFQTDLPPAADFVRMVRADAVQAKGISGAGVTVAVVDTGFDAIDGLAMKRNHAFRIRAGYDAINNSAWTAYGDGSGHGTHVTSIALNSDVSAEGAATGMAPNANLVFVRAFDADGQGSYVNVIAGLDWILKNRAQYNIRVLNLSFSAPVRSQYWDDPINQAVMRLWEAGVVVVASAGNEGPGPMTIGVPGNTPYVITVGAMSDHYTAAPGDDVLASFSSAGPTYEGFVKPEVVAPGGHITALMPAMTAKIAREHPEFQITENYFQMSGTSQSTAVVTGLVALLLEAKPWLTPDDVKCQLMASARPALTDTGELAYAVFQQGAGMVDAVGAIESTELACANRGLDVRADLAGTAHFAGLANRDAEGNYYIMGVDGFLWSNGFLWSKGFLWSNANLTSDGFLWSNGFLWSKSDLDTNGFLWSNATGASVGVNRWVDQE